jgi:YVTN family beta-propeller protein
MDLIEGTDLRGLLNREGGLDPEHAVRVIEQVAAALDVAHARGLVHRDIKPGNVLIEEHDGAERVYLTDFGLARQVEASTGVTATGAFVGTLDYVAPEQIRGERVDARADIYALGCVLFELLTGNPPFAAREDKVAKMYAHLQEEPPRLRVLRPDLPGELDLILARAMAKDPAERFPSAGDFARAAASAIEGQPTAETERSVATGAAAPGPPEDTTTTERLRDEQITLDRPPGREPEATRELPEGAGARRRNAPLLAAIGALIVAAVIAAVVLGGGGDEEPSAPGGGAPSADTEAPSADTEAPPKASIDGDPVAVGDLPVNLVHGQEALWVANRVGQSVSEVDGDPAEEANEFSAGMKAEGLAVAEGSIWVSGTSQPVLRRFDPSGEPIGDPIAVGAPPGNVAFGEGFLWVANSGEGTVTQVDPGTATVAGEVPVGNAPYGITFGSGAVWVTNRADDSVVQINPGNRNTSDPIAVGDNPKGIAFAENSVWVANADDGTVSRIQGGRVKGEPIPVGVDPRGVAAGFGSVWVAVGGGSVVRIDARTGDKLQTIDIGGSPEGVAAGPKSVWVADGINGTVIRIDPGS